MKKHLLLVFCVLALGAQAQTLRDAVAVVRPNYTAETVKFLTDFSTSLRRDGYKAAADVLAAYAKGGYGTGILWKNPKDNRYYIITNRHVVAQAKDVRVEFMPADGAEVKYVNCPIVAVDEGTEMALVALPDTAVFASSLAFSSAGLKDGDEVYTAGFPGLGSDPSWQLGKGIVSNSSARLKDWTVQKAAKIIQHTAQVDAGSSGGPLLVKDNSALGYAIVGINTWQAAHRENANFSVSVATMQAFVDRHFIQQAMPRETLLRNRAESFAGAVKEGYRSVYSFISDDYIGNISVNNFYELLNSLSDSVAKEVGRCFGNGLPVDGVRVGLAEALSSRFAKQAMAFGSVENVSDTAAQVVFLYGNTPVTSSWSFRHGVWGMSNFAALSMRDMARSGVATSFGYRNAVLVGIGFPANSLANMHYSLGYEYTTGTFLVFGFDVGKGSFDNPYTDRQLIKGKWEEKDTVRTIGIFDMNMHVGLQFPVKLGALYVIPNAKLYWGVTTFDDSDSYDPFVIHWGYSAGVSAAYKLQRRTYLIGGLQYRTLNLGEDFSRARPHALEVVLGITF